MKIIGITGGTGAGKTTALRALEVLDAWIIDADRVYHDLTRSNLDLRHDLESRFGKLYHQDGWLDRKKLGNIVFNDPKALQDLNALAHHYIGAEIDRQLLRARETRKPVAAIDAIGLIESGLSKKCDCKVAIIAPPELRIKRIMAREGISEEYARSRVLAQKDEMFFRIHCEYVLENKPGDTPEYFSARALELFRQILAQ